MSCLSKWWQDRTKAQISNLIERLTKVQPPNWKGIDQEVIKWPRAGEMWNRERKTLNQLARIGSIAQEAVPVICRAGEDTMWAHCTIKQRDRRAGCSFIAHLPLVFSGHHEEHVTALVAALQALQAIKPRSAEAIPFLLDVVDESGPQSDNLLHMQKRNLRQFQEMGMIRDIPDDIPMRAVIRGLALTVLGQVLGSLQRSGEQVLDCTARILPALHDSAFTVRITAVAALMPCRQGLSPLKREELDSSVAAILSSPETASAARRAGISSEQLREVVRRWQSGTT